MSNNPKQIICTRGKTDIVIDEKNQTIILGASASIKDPGIIVIADKTGQLVSDRDMAKIEACKKQITYYLPPQSVIEIACT
jgi:hypothetical protein